MALGAKFFVFISFDAVYVYSAELFPTVIRLDKVHLCDLLPFPFLSAIRISKLSSKKLKYLSN